MKSLGLRKSLAVCLVMALLLSMLVLQGGLASEYLVADETILTPFTGSISLDVNPSIELKIENGMVTQALAYNDDGQSMLENSDVTGLTAEEAVKVMTKALAEGGYLATGDSAPYLVITVSGSGTQEEDAAEALQNAARQVAEELGTELEIKSAFAPDDVAAQAAAAGLSAGKYLLLQYIAKTEGITLDEAIAQYGTAKISDLMNQFEDAGDAFDFDGLLLTEEQRTALELAFAQQKQSITAAEKAFHDAFKSIKSAYREKVHSTVKAKKGVDDQTVFDTLNQLKEQMLAEYQSMRQTLDDAANAARAAFQEAVAAAGIPEEISKEYYAWHMNKEVNVEGELNAFLKEFTFKAEGKEDKEETLFTESKDDSSKEEGQNGQEKDRGKDQKSVKAQDEDQDEDRDEDQGQEKGTDED
jgi:nucleotide-binding universal stress UspA family protein